MHSFPLILRRGGAVLLLAALGACEQPPQPAPTSPEVPGPQSVAPEQAPPAAPPAAPAAPPVASTSSMPGTATAPAAPEPAAPAVESMARAVPTAKLGVPVELRYQFDDAVLPDRPVTLHLAAVPRVAGSNLAVSIKEAAGIRVGQGALHAQRADATVPYRQRLQVTRSAGSPGALRVLVTMDLPEGSAFSYFSLPFEGAGAVRKQVDATQR